jgi:hypothetical protein
VATTEVIGGKITAYNAELTAHGLTENTRIADIEYTGGTVADKNFFLRLLTKDGDAWNGNMEGCSLGFEAYVLYQFPRSRTMAASQVVAWDNLGAIERALLGFSAGRGEALKVGTVTLELEPTGNQDWYVGTIPFTVWFPRSTKE